jgi:hypothetical protein
MARATQVLEHLTADHDHDDGGDPAEAAQQAGTPGVRVDGIGDQQHRWLIPGGRLARGLEGGRCRGRPAGRLGSPAGRIRNLQRSDQPVGFGEDLLHLLKAGSACHTASQVLLDLAYLGEVQLTIE